VSRVVESVRESVSNMGGGNEEGNGGGNSGNSGNE
jgi:hypothetical protein